MERKEEIMKITEEKLIEMLKELHEYYWKVGRKLHASGSGSPDHVYETGKADGASEAVNAILLQVIGGEAMYEILEKDWNKAAQGDGE